MEIVVADIGGTHARFATATVRDGVVVALSAETTFKTRAFVSLATAWEAFAQQRGGLPRAAAIAVACPIVGEVLKLTNNPWMIRPASLGAELGLDALTLINDFAAVGHAVGGLGREAFTDLCGPPEDLPEDGVISIVGPGTGLGVAHLLRRGGVRHVIAGEGGHADFAPVDVLEDQLLVRLRALYRRVSIERIVSGPGLANIYAALAAVEGRASPQRDDAALWADAISGEDPLAAAALDRFCLALGGVAGDIALCQGAAGVVIAGGVGARLAHILPASGFASRFTAKGRFESVMAGLPVKLLTHPQPGLYGAAVAFLADFGAVA